MNKEITIYELLGLIKDGQAPKKIKYYDRIFEYEYQLKDYYYESYSLFEDGIEIISDSLNDKVEIIEEDKKIKKLPYYSLEKIQKAPTKDIWFDERVSLLEKRVNDYHNKINELIDEVNALKENNK